MASNLGTICTLLPAIHNLTGSNYTSKIRIKSAALKANPEKFLTDFCHYIHEPKCSETFSKLEAYLVQVFKKGK